MSRVQRIVSMALGFLALGLGVWGLVLAEAVAPPAWIWVLFISECLGGAILITVSW